MELHRRKPIIIERMETWKAKGKPSQKVKAKTPPGFLSTVARGAGIIGGKIGSGLKSVATAENAQKLGNWGRNTGEFIQSRSFVYDPPFKKAQQKKTKKKKR